MPKYLLILILLLMSSCAPATAPTPTFTPFSLPTSTRALPSPTLTRTPPVTLVTVSSPPKSSLTLPPKPSPTPIDPAWVRARACEALVNHSSNPLAGRLVRFKTPIQVNTAGIPAASAALRVIETKTNHVVTFTEVNKNPETGIIFVLGDAVRPDGTPGCGNVTSQPDPRSGVRLPAASSGELTGRMVVHLGGINSTGCKYSPDRLPYPIAEHEMGHALGLGLHFTNFNGDEGFSDELAAVIQLIYAAPIGTPSSAFCK